MPSPDSYPLTPKCLPILRVLHLTARGRITRHMATTDDWSGCWRRSV